MVLLLRLLVLARVAVIVIAIVVLVVAVLAVVALGWKFTHSDSPRKLHATHHGVALLCADGRYFSKTTVNGCITKTRKYSELEGLCCSPYRNLHILLVPRKNPEGLNKPIPQNM